MSLSRDQLLEGLRAAAEATRLRLLIVCAYAELSVSELTQVLGQSQPRVSRHLKLLCDAGLLERTREQNNVYYRVPARGGSAELTARILALLPDDDASLNLDRARVDSVLADRARHLETARREYGEALARQGNERQFDAVLLAALAETRLGDLLDIGTGGGHMLTLLAPHAESAIGIDSSREMRMLARARLHEAGLNQVPVRQDDMYRLSYSSASFDTITLDQVLSQAERPQDVLREAVRLLRPNGQLIVVDYDAERLREGGLSGAQLRDWLLGSGLRAIRSITIPDTPLVLTLGMATAHDRAGVAA